VDNIKVTSVEDVRRLQITTKPSPVRCMLAGNCSVDVQLSTERCFKTCVTPVKLFRTQGRLS
jgi:hypothetical protein